MNTMMAGKRFNKSQIKEINQKIADLYCVEEFFTKNYVIELIDKRFITKDGAIMFFYQDGLIVPSLKNLLTNNFLKKIVET